MTQHDSILSCQNKSLLQKKHKQRMPENNKNNVAYYKKKKKDDAEVIGTRKEPTLRAPSSTKTNTPTEAKILYQVKQNEK